MDHVLPCHKCECTATSRHSALHGARLQVCFLSSKGACFLEMPRPCRPSVSCVMLHEELRYPGGHAGEPKKLQLEAAILLREWVDELQSLLHL